ncbi:hypothetical protein AAMO2058_001067200 [Amorphochlora amoebiformis]
MDVIYTNNRSGPGADFRRAMGTTGGGKDEAAVLRLEQFSRPPYLDFGLVRRGSTKTLKLVVENPSEVKTQSLCLDRLPGDKGFWVAEKIISVPPLSSKNLELSWNPNGDSTRAPGKPFKGKKKKTRKSGTDDSKHTSVRATALFKLNARFRLQLVLLGTAYGRSSARSDILVDVSPNTMADLDATLDLGKSSSNSLNRRTDLNATIEMPRRSMQRKAHSGWNESENVNSYSKPTKPKTRKKWGKPKLKFVTGGTTGGLKLKRIATKKSIKKGKMTLLRDDQGVFVQQEKAFTTYLNSILAPDASPAPAGTGTSNEIARLLRMREHACLRATAFDLYKSSVVSRQMEKIRCEVEREGFKVRSDRQLHADVGLRRWLTDSLLKYNPLWLRIGLEATLGIGVDSKAAKGLSGSNLSAGVLSACIKEFLLNDNEVLARCTEKLKLSSGRESTAPRFRKSFIKEMGKMVIRKTLQLVIFLEHAKLAGVLGEADPPLFLLDAPFKSTKEVCAMIAKELLSGEGNILRHLSLMGISLAHKQTHLEEYHFKVENIKTDLRDGVRLCRIAQLLGMTADPESVPDAQSAKQSVLLLRLPASSRLRKVHNMKVAIKALRAAGVPVCDTATPGRGNDACLRVNHQSIVDGNQSTTLSLLWQVVLARNISILPTEALKKETKRLQGSPIRHTAGQTASPAKEVFFHAPQQMQGLLEWAAAVVNAAKGSYYDEMESEQTENGVPFSWPRVTNFTTSFVDGRAVCLIVHYYLPAVLPLSSFRLITHRARHLQALEDADDETGNLGNSQDYKAGWAQFYSFGTHLSESEATQDAKDRAHNWRAFNKAVSSLGGVPAMIRPATSDPQLMIDEKVVITALALLFPKLMSAHKHVKAVMAKMIKEKRRKWGAPKPLVILGRADAEAAAKRNAERKKMEEAEMRKLEEENARAEEEEKRRKREEEGKRRRALMEKAKAEWRRKRQQEMMREEEERKERERRSEEKKKAFEALKLQLPKSAAAQGLIVSARLQKRREEAEAKRSAILAKRFQIFKLAAAQGLVVAERLHKARQEAEAKRAAILAMRLQTFKLAASHGLVVAARLQKAREAAEAKWAAFLAVRQQTFKLTAARANEIAFARAEAMRKRRDEERHLAAICIQTNTRRYLAKKHLIRLCAERKAAEEEKARQNYLSLRSRAMTAAAQKGAEMFATRRAAEAKRAAFEALKQRVSKSAASQGRIMMTKLRQVQAAKEAKRQTYLTARLEAIKLAASRAREIALAREETERNKRQEERNLAATHIQSIVRSYFARKILASLKAECKAAEEKARQEFLVLRSRAIVAAAAEGAALLSARRAAEEKELAKKRAFEALRMQAIKSAAAKGLVVAARLHKARAKAEAKRAAILSMRLQAFRMAAAQALVVSERLQKAREEVEARRATMMAKRLLTFKQAAMQGLVVAARLQKAREATEAKRRAIMALRLQTFQLAAARATQLAVARAEANRKKREEKRNLASIRIQTIARKYLAKKILVTLRAERKAVEEEKARQDFLALRSRTILAAAAEGAKLFAARRAAEAKELAKKMAFDSLKRQIARSAAAQGLIVAARMYKARKATEAKRKAFLTMRLDTFKLAATRAREIVLAREEAERKKEEEKELAAICIQRLGRRYLARRYLASLLTKRKEWEAAIRIQAIFRGAKSRIEAKRLRRERNELEGKRRLAKLDGAATSIQALWKGWKIRKKARKNPRLRKSLARLKALEKKTKTEDTVGARMKSALEILLDSKRLSTVGWACKELSRMTCLLPLFCIEAVEQNAVGALLHLMRRCNRSRPHILIVQHGLEVLRNISKCWRTAEHVYNHELCADVLMEIMQVYRDIPTIYRCVIGLLHHGVRHFPYFATKINETTDHTQKIKQIYQLLKRKAESARKVAANSRSKTSAEKYKMLKKCTVATKVLLESLKRDRVMATAAKALEAKKGRR